MGGERPPAVKIYISGPISAVGPPTWNFPAFNAAARELARAGYDVVNPADKGIIDGWSWADYMRVDIIEMLGCDGVALLPDWNLSDGALLETQVARACGLRAEPLDYWLSLRGESFAKSPTRVETPAGLRDTDPEPAAVCD